MSSKVVCDSDVESFESAGVVCLRQVIDPTLVAELGNALDILTSGIGDSAAGYDLTDLRRQIFEGTEHVHAGNAGRQHDISGLASLIRASNLPPLLDPFDDALCEDGHFTVDTTTWKRDPIIRSVALDSAVPCIAGALLRAQKVNFCDDQIFVKAPHTVERTAFHQDLGYFHLSGSQGCVVWICADKAGPRAGVPVYLRGSHRTGIEYAPNVFVTQTTLPGSRGESLADIEREFSQHEPITFEVEPGDIIVHHFLTVHGAGGNHSDRPRRALSLRYAGEKVRFKRRAGAPDQPYHDHSLQDGDHLDSKQYPVVWPRPFPEFKLASLYR